MDAIDVRILGPLEVALAGREVRLASAMQRRMLAALVLFANQVVSADRLIEALWRDAPPATAAHAVHVYVSRLRRLLGPGPDAPDLPPLLLTRAPGYLLRVGADSLDIVELVMAFEEEFGVEIPDDAAEKIATVKDAIDYIDSKQ